MIGTSAAIADYVLPQLGRPPARRRGLRDLGRRAGRRARVSASTHESPTRRRPRLGVRQPALVAVRRIGQPHRPARRPRPVGARLRPPRHAARQRPVLRERRADPRQLPGPDPVRGEDGVRGRASRSSSPTPTGCRRSRRSRRSSAARSRRSCAALEALVTAAGSQAIQRGQLLIPSPKFVNAGISLQRRWVVDLMRALRELAGGGFIAMPSAETFEAEETADDVGRYYRSATLSAHDRVALLKVMWDLVGSEFARPPAPVRDVLDVGAAHRRPADVPLVRLGGGSGPRPAAVRGRLSRHRRGDAHSACWRRQAARRAT